MFRLKHTKQVHVGTMVNSTHNNSIHIEVNIPYLGLGQGASPRFRQANPQWLSICTVYLSVQIMFSIELPLKYIEHRLKLELCRAHTPHADCAIYIELLCMHDYNLVDFRKLVEMLLNCTMS